MIAGVMLDKGIDAVKEWAQAGENPAFVTFKRKDVVEMVEMLKGDEDLVFNWDFLNDTEDFLQGSSFGMFKGVVDMNEGATSNQDV